MNTVFALAGIVIKEMYRRKDFYVLFVLTALLTIAAGTINFFHDEKIVRYLKDVCLFLIWVCALIIALTTTARQIPAEREQRTIFPLLAKPVSRGQVILGKFLGCWLATAAALLMFYVFFAVIIGSREQSWPLNIYLQAFWMQLVMLGVVIALSLLGSIYFAAPSSTVTICFILVAAILFIGGHLQKIALNEPEPLQTIVFIIYFLIPHLEWYDLRDFVVYNHGSVSWFYIFLATLMAAGYAGIFLFLTWLGFRRKSLST
jgi:ABC-type transport system involved in multi-copper enzyme maturation permease subunit